METRHIQFSANSRFEVLHVEAPGCIVNITKGLGSTDGEDVTHVEIIAHDSEGWEIKANGLVRRRSLGMRLVRKEVK